MSLATQLGTCAKFVPNKSYHTSYHACTKYYSDQLALLSIAIAMGCGTFMLQVMTLMSLSETYYIVQSVLVNSEQPGHNNTCT